MCLMNKININIRIYSLTKYVQIRSPSTNTIEKVFVSRAIYMGFDVLLTYGNVSFEGWLLKIVDTFVTKTFVSEKGFEVTPALMSFLLATFTSFYARNARCSNRQMLSIRIFFR